MAIKIPAHEYELIPIRSGGPGGQHVNKVESGIQLRFDIQASSLSNGLKQRILKLRDKRITKEGILVIEATGHRSQHKNREEAISRLKKLVKKALKRPKNRVPTKPTKASKEARLKRKKKRGEIKKNRGKVNY